MASPAGIRSSSGAPKRLFDRDRTKGMGAAFAARKGGAGLGEQMQTMIGAESRGAGIAAGVAGGVPDLMRGITQIATAGNAGPDKADRNKARAQGALNTAAGGAMMAGGPIGMAVAAPLKLVSMLLNIKGPRKRRQERRRRAQEATNQEFMGRAKAIQSAAALPGTLGGGGGFKIDNSATAATASDFSALVPDVATRSILGV